jgi:hypothetical protein
MLFSEERRSELSLHNPFTYNISSKVESENTKHIPEVGTQRLDK